MNPKAIIISIIVIVLIIIGSVVLYLYSNANLPRPQNYMTENDDATKNINYEDDSPATISADFNATPGDASLNGEFDVLDRDVEGF